MPDLILLHKCLPQGGFFIILVTTGVEGIVRSITRTLVDVIDAKKRPQASASVAYFATTGTCCLKQ